MGGAIFNVNSSPMLTDCSFTGNTCVNNGGGIYNTNYGSTLTAINCTFTGNIATNGIGGGIYTVSSAKFDGLGCSFTGNEAILAGGIYHGSIGVSTITGSRFEGNMATSSEGGGLYNTGGIHLKVTKCFFSGNTGVTNGGGMLNYGGSTAIDHSVFSGNTAGTTGGGMYNIDASPRISHCTFNANSASNNGGAIFNVNSSPVIINTIIHGSVPNGVIHSGGNSAVSYSLVQGGFTGIGIVDADPLFIDADGDDETIGTADDNLRLQSISPAIDAGDTTGLPLEDITDLDSSPRAPDDPETADTGLSIVIPLTGENAVTDIGAYEFQPVDSCANTLDADINCDGQVNLTDLVMLALEWLQMP